jgi:hypothetical protein
MQIKSWFYSSTQHSALSLEDIGPFAYNLNLFAIKPSKIKFYWTLDDWVFFI